MGAVTAFLCLILDDGSRELKPAIGFCSAVCRKKRKLIQYFANNNVFWAMYRAAHYHTDATVLELFTRPISLPREDLSQYKCLFALKNKIQFAINTQTSRLFSIKARAFDKCTWRLYTMEKLFWHHPQKKNPSDSRQCFVITDPFQNVFHYWSKCSLSRL